MVDKLYGKKVTLAERSINRQKGRGKRFNNEVSNLFENLSERQEEIGERLENEKLTAFCDHDC